MRKSVASLFRKLVVIVSCFLWISTASAQNDTLPNTVSLSYEHSHFDKQFTNDWRLTSLEYKRQGRLGAVLGRINYANRFAQSGWQGEVEAYPVISKTLYAFAALSYANEVPVFARWRSGTSLYYNFAKGWEAEGGFRYLYFDQSIWMGTAGVSRYLGPWLLNARSFFSIAAPMSSQSYFLKLQRFLKNERDYVWLQAGSGVSPDESRSIQLNAATQLVSKRIAAGSRLSLTNRFQLNITGGYARDEYREKTFGNQFYGSAGVSVRF